MSLMTKVSIDQPLVSVIMVNWNVPTLVVDAINSLYQKGGLEREQIELFLIDNASSDQSLKVFSEKLPLVKVIKNKENVGFGRANNQVYNQCRGQYVFLLNPDTVVKEDALKNAIALMGEHPDWGVLGLRLLNADGSFQRAGGGAFPQIKSLAWNYLWLNKIIPKCISPPPLFLEDDPQGTQDIDWVSGAALLLRPESCDGQLFDHDFWMYGEDIDLCKRVASNGYKVIYTSEISIVHLSGQSVKQQQDENLLVAPIKGPRAFYQRTHGSSKLWLYDLILFCGYTLRVLIFKTLTVFKFDRDYAALAQMSLKHLITTTKHFGSAK